MKTVMKYQSFVGNIVSLLLATANVIAISFVIILFSSNGIGI